MADDTVVERFRAFLRDKALPVTGQRLVIAELVLAATGQLSAEDVAVQLRAAGHTVGLATVYRTIDLLVESGLVVERDFGEGFRRFERTRDISERDQLSCTVCGAVEEFRDERIESFTRGLAAARGFARKRHRLVIHGICRACQQATHAIERSST